RAVLRAADQHAGRTRRDRDPDRRPDRDGFREPPRRRPARARDRAAARAARRARTGCGARAHRPARRAAGGRDSRSTGDVVLAAPALEDRAARSTSGEELMHRYPIRVRYDDTDQMGFAYYAHYL